MKKVISVLLTTVMLISILSVGASAASAETVERMADAQEMIAEDLGQAKVNTELVKTVAHDQELLEKASLAESVSISEVRTDGTVIYENVIGETGVIDYIVVSENENGDIILDITENDKRDKLIYKKDGSIVLDGHEVIIEHDTTQPITESTQLSMDSIARVGMIPSSKTYALPNGEKSVPSYFSKTGKTYATNRITFEKYLSNIAVSTVISVAANAVKGGFAAIAAGLSALAIASAIQLAFEYAQDQVLLMLQSHTTSKTASFSAVQYVNKNNDTLHAEWLYLMKLYGEANYVGTPTNSGVLEMLDAT